MDDARITEVYYQLRSKRLAPEPIKLELDEFKALYNTSLTLNQRQVPRVVVINVGDRAYVMFPEWSRQEIVVECKGAIEEEDFAFLSMVDWHGATGARQTFPSFIATEITENWPRITGVFLLSITVLLLAGPALSAYDLIHTLLIQASTVFLSIYLIFTVAQSERLSYDRKLFDRGILHKYYAHDRNITQFGILTVGMVFANAILVSSGMVNPTLQSPLPSAMGRWIAAISTSLVLSMLFHTFFIVADYYLERTRDVAEREHIGRVLHEEYCREHPEDCEPAE